MATPDASHDLATAARSAAYHDALAGRYDELMSGPADTFVRERFRALLAATLTTGARVLDFGCGTGVDAAWLAERGHPVLAYDNSTAMRERARLRFSALAADRRPTILDVDFAHFLDHRPEAPEVDAVVANFAVLNMLPRLEPVLESFAARLSAGGVAVVSVLSPGYWEDMLRRAHWLVWLRGWRSGTEVVTGPTVALHRHHLGRIRRAVGVAWRVERLIGADLILRFGRSPGSWDAPRGFPQRFEKAFGESFPWNRLGRFRFLVLRRI